jgi:hypothetical protein
LAFAVFSKLHSGGEKADIDVDAGETELASAKSVCIRRGDGTQRQNQVIPKNIKMNNEVHE